MAKEFEKLVRLVFASHRDAKEFHFTSDGQAFKDPTDAANHARSLENKEVSLITRSQLVEGGIIAPKAAAAKTQTGTEGGAKNDFQAKGAKGSGAGMGDEAREELVRKYEMLSGKKAGTLKTETLTTKVAELESAAATGNATKAENDPAKDAKEPGAETGEGVADQTTKTE